MKIYVCVKHVPDSAATIAILGETDIDERITFLMNPYDENAVAEAVRLKESIPGSEVIAATAGKKEASKTLRSAMAMGADRSIHIVSETNIDSIATAKALCRAIRQDGTPDIVFTGKESIDSEGMQTMFRIAAEFDMPIATGVTFFDLRGKTACVHYELESGAKEVAEMDIPCVVAAGKSLNRPKYPTLPQIVKSKKKEIKTLDLHLLLEKMPTSGTEIIALREATVARKSEKLSGTPEKIADRLVEILKHEAKGS